jgi:hypothetical protein
MSFIKSSTEAYRQVLEAVEREHKDHEVSMARGECESIADRALAISAMLEGMPEEGNPLPAWVQSKITNACDYITTVHDYLKYNPSINESLELLNELGSNAALSKKSYSPAAAAEVAKQIFLKTPSASTKSDYVGDIKGNITNTQLANIKKVWANKTKNDLTPELLKFIAKLDLPTRVAIGQANINVLSKLVKEEVDLEETSLSSIHKMKEDGKTSEEIAKELKLNAGLVKKILGEEVELEEIELKEFNDAEIAQLKKEFDPLKGKQISTARANQLSNILNKLDDSSLDKLKSALIPFVSALAAAKTTQRKFRGVKITNVKVPGLENMAEEVELKPVPSLEDSAKKHNVNIEALKKQLEKGIKAESEHTDDPKVAEKIALAHLDERPDYYNQLDKMEKKPVEKIAEVTAAEKLQAKVKERKKEQQAGIDSVKAGIDDIKKPSGGFGPSFGEDVKEPTGELKDACWTGYVAVGTKMKNGKRVPNCVPKSEAYKGAKSIVEKAWKKLKEKNND